MLALELDGVHADVDEQLDSACGSQTVGVPGREGHENLAVDRGYDRPLSGGDGHARAEHAGGEGLVLHLGQRDRTPLDRSGDGEVLGGLIGQLDGLGVLGHGLGLQGSLIRLTDVVAGQGCLTTR